jgi:hypothetical protein
MMVAWHEVPGKANITVPSRRGRCDLWLYGQVFRADAARAQGCESAVAHQTVPYGTDSGVRFSRHFVPGYHHPVPAGQLDKSNRTNEARAKALGGSVGTFHGQATRPQSSVTASRSSTINH